MSLMILESSGGSEFFLDKTNVVIPELSYMEKGGRKERPHSPFGKSFGEGEYLHELALMPHADEC
jgi:hypothetical protein